MTLASPSQQDSQHLLEKRHAQSDGVILRGETPNAKPACSPILGRKCTNQDNNNNKWICVINLPAFPLVPSFCFLGVWQSKRCKRSQLITQFPPRKVSKMQSMLIFSPTPRLLLHTLAKSFLGKEVSPPCLLLSPIQPSFQSPVQRQGRHVVVWVRASSHPSLL